MKVIDSGGNLVCYLFGSLFSDFEVLGLEVVKEIASLEILHDYVNVVGILEHVVESDDIGMLADFQYFDLSFEELEVLEGELFLFDNFDGNLFQ